MLALETFNREEIQTLKKEMEEYRWNIRNIDKFQTYNITNKKCYAKIVLFLFVLNPLILLPGMAILHTHPYWAVFPSDDENVDAVLIVIYLLFVLGSCGVVYSHVLLHVYFGVCLKIQMELLAQYFEEQFTVAGCSDRFSERYITQQCVYHWLINGIIRHGELLG